ncbi:hypothetical protein ACKI2N_026485 [Cupriavidus sp. 30B13]
MKRFAAFATASWSAAALVYFGQHSTAMLALSAIVALAGLDIASGL